MQTFTSLIPENVDGKPLDVEKQVMEKSTDKAISVYRMAYNRLKNPDSWDKMPGFDFASFMLRKRNSNSSEQFIEIGDHISIDIPGPGPNNGDGLDWVRLEDMQENFDNTADESFGMRVRACANPVHDTGNIAAHFFKDKATSTFIIKRKGQTVTVYYYGRNEVVNLKNASLHDKIRNTAVALVALSGFSKMQWNSFIACLLKK